MTAHATIRFTVDEYLAWAQDNPGRYELFQGQVFAMAPETARHAEIKGNLQIALRAAIRKAGLRCYALPDGMTVRISADTSYEPDALVYCGEKLPGAAVEVPEPVIVVEVLSPSTRRVDVTRKLADYFRLPSVQHYLIAETERRQVIHHAREGETIRTRIVTEGVLDLDPPGLTLSLDEIYEDEPPAE